MRIQSTSAHCHSAVVSPHARILPNAQIVRVDSTSGVDLVNYVQICTYTIRAQAYN